MAEYLLAHDLGTTGDKATLFDLTGGIIASVFEPYPTNYPKPGWAEQHPADWWHAVCLSSRRLLDLVPAAKQQLRGVGFSAMMNGCLLIDAAGEVIRPALIHADTRSTDQCLRIEREIGEIEAYRITGNRIAPYFTLSKLAWLIQNEPENAARARWCVQTKDYIGARLTGNWGVTDYSDASLTGFYDINARSWHSDIIRFMAIPQQLLAEVRESSSILGYITGGAADQTGLPAGLPVVVGGGDGACATAGAGAVNAGDTYHYLGGTSWVAGVTPGFQPDPKRRVSAFITLDPGKCVLYGTVQSAGSSVDWVRTILTAPDRAGETSSFEDIEELASKSPVGSRGLYFLPYLAGERSPIWDASARGAFFGLMQAHDRSDMARSVFEGVAYALGSNLQVLEELGMAKENALKVLGGGMRSALWRSILAAVYQRPLQLLENLSEATSCGAAMATAVGIGAYTDYAAAAIHFARIAETELPDPQAINSYRKGAEFFCSLYPSMAERFAALNEMTSK